MCLGPNQAEVEERVAPLLVKEQPCGGMADHGPRYFKDEMSWHINIKVNHRTREEAVKGVERILSYLKEGYNDGSEHPDDYMPYFWFSAIERE
jgi:hypothetical protein